MHLSKKELRKLPLYNHFLPFCFFNFIPSLLQGGPEWEQTKNYPVAATANSVSLYLRTSSVRSQVHIFPYAYGEAMVCIVCMHIATLYLFCVAYVTLLFRKMKLYNIHIDGWVRFFRFLCYVFFHGLICYDFLCICYILFWSIMNECAQYARIYHDLYSLITKYIFGDSYELFN